MCGNPPHRRRSERSFKVQASQGGVYSARAHLGTGQTEYEDAGPDEPSETSDQSRLDPGKVEAENKRK